jgi:hypothetical protein
MRIEKINFYSGKKEYRQKSKAGEPNINKKCHIVYPG